MRSDTSRVIKNIFAIFLGRLSPRIFSFLFVIFVARFLGASEFGKFALAVGYFELFLLLASKGVTIIATREIAKTPAKAGEYVTVSIALGLMLTVLASLILIGLSRILPYSADTRMALCLACIALLPSTIATVYEAGFVGFEKAHFVTYGTVIENSLRTGLWFIAIILGYKLLVLFVVLIITRTVLLIFYSLCYSRYIAPLRRGAWKIYRTFINEWRTIAFENWLSSVVYGFDVILLSIMCGEYVVGIYSAAYKIVNIGDIAASSYTVAIFPYMSRLYKESLPDFQKLAERSLKFMIILLIPAIMIMSATGDRIIFLIYGKEYTASVPIFSVLLWVIVLRFLNPFLSHVLFAKGEQGNSLRVAVMSLTVYVPLSIFFIRLWGGVGAAWAVLVVSILGFILFFAFVWRGYGVQQSTSLFGPAGVSSLCFAVTFFALKDISLPLSIVVPLLLYCFLIYRLEAVNYR